MKRKITFFIIAILAPLLSLAQPGPPPNPDVPITGIEILLVLGGALGFKQMLGLKRKSK